VQVSRPEAKVAAGPPAAIALSIPPAAPTISASGCKIAPSCKRTLLVTGGCVIVVGMVLVAFCLVKLSWGNGRPAFRPAQLNPAFAPLQGLAPGLPMPKIQDGSSGGPRELHEPPADDALDQEEERLIQEMRHAKSPAETRRIMSRFLEIQRRRAQKARKDGR
jgi:hypothetical protein